LKIEGLDSSAQKVAMAPDGETIIALCRENLVFCDPRSGKTAMRVLATGHCLAYQPGFPNNVLFAQPTNLHLSRTPKMAIGKVHDFPLKSPQYGAFAPDGKSIVVSFGAQINPVLLDTTTPLERYQFSGAPTEINSVAVSYNGLVAGAGNDNRIYLWTVPKMP
jgi:WD40 repeat protein